MSEASERTRRIVIHLEDPAQLFTANPPPPSSPNYTEFTAQPAMETVREVLLMRLPRKHTHVEIDLVLPGKYLHPGLDEELTTAVRRWVRVQSRMQGEATEAEGVIGRRLFVVGVLAFLFLQTLSILVKKYGDFWNDYLIDALGEGLSVTSWVMLWFPVQIFTVEAWRSSIRRRRMRALERIVVRTHAHGTQDDQPASQHS
jgi:hypothetical protein